MKMCARPLELTPASTSLDGWKAKTLWIEVMMSPPVTATADGFLPPAPTLYRWICVWDEMLHG